MTDKSTRAIPSRGRVVRAPAVSADRPGGKPLKATNGPSTISKSSEGSATTKTSRVAGGSSQRPIATESKQKTTTTKATPSTKLPNGNISKAPSSTLSQEHIPTRTSDRLQIAAQACSWAYMVSTLQTCFQKAESSARNALDNRSKLLAEEEAEISDQRTRFDAERAIAFYEELATDTFAEEAPSIMEAFLRHGKVCAQVNGDALRLAARPPTPLDSGSPVQPYNDMLTKLEQLQDDTRRLESSIAQLLQVDRKEPRSQAYTQIISAFAACLPVVQARAANLMSAHELISCSKENVAVNLHLESLRIM